MRGTEQQKTDGIGQPLPSLRAHARARSEHGGSSDIVTSGSDPAPSLESSAAPAGGSSDIVTSGSSGGRGGAVHRALEPMILLTGIQLLRAKVGIPPFAA